MNRLGDATGKQIRCLQALRGVACLAVVVFHLGHWEAMFWPPWPMLKWSRPFGWAGADLFFVLSGFIITWTQFGRLGQPAELRGYLGRRLWRIFPLYWSVWVFVAGANYVMYRGTFEQHGGMAACFNQLFLMPADVGRPYVPVAWTLTYEVIFYIVFSVFIVCPRRWFLGLLTIWTASVFVNFLLAPPALAGPIGLPFSPMVAEFLAGCWAAVAYRHAKRGIDFSLAAGLTGAVLALICLNVWTKPGGPWRGILLGPAFALVVYGLTGLERSGRLRPPSWLCRIGDASYSIYLMHWTCGEIVLFLTPRWPHDPLRHLPWVVVMSIAMIGGGYLWYLAVERPLVKLAMGQRRNYSKPPVCDGPNRRAA